ncbi:MAG TPA: glycosyltransferase family 2 protein [Leptospiraceae bacterium]|nr:glycosyltransferase family 2 protein [Leptospiraceae bacterium]HMW03440.1 glycosyltransferase family 2 protein [Leptospiraceae bacterium]HMX31573.1 glycosyltransferase family 2 protein [Leptospiraceae bacterium]HMY29640.1 glycosyltransferase family 2 protein [Leptospiraceae bacterium]HMZ66178.1 glycosyltransferase family 2 protein [Leptospiraceae bacterium]
MKKLTIVIPCYNEEKNIPLILERLVKVVKRDDIEFLLVDNGSTDGSKEVLEKLIPKYNFAKTIRVPVNQGYGFGILQGLAATDSLYIGWTHADMQTDPYDIIRGLEILEKEETKDCYVKGSRTGRPIFDQFFTIGMSFFETLYMGKPLWDINAQPNIFPRTFFESWKNPPHDFSLDLYALYQAKIQGLKVLRFTVVFPPRIHGQSSWNTGLKAKWKFIKRTFDFSIKLKKELKN